MKKNWNNPELKDLKLIQTRNDECVDQTKPEDGIETTCYCAYADPSIFNCKYRVFDWTCLKYKCTYNPSQATS
ncbi:hypothetical protein LQE93_16280 [Clostridium sp. NSJ-145]|uniref:hypothetical protein n=1 Tax=Clostridium sp. NSJ-145 TaxID=2897777 RepID=UPI001E64A75E|nr:hypothetical protein [Clostridium sp. NSJ-145]MCD2503294.1 hypothetical protein [Clostridium sp. NSJ-145]